MASRQWTAEDLSQLMRGYQGSCILAAAAELDLMGTFAKRTFTAEQAAEELKVDQRGITILLDALTALQLLDKKDSTYTVPSSVACLLSGDRPGNQLAMAQHQANCLRRWSQLASILRTGQPAQDTSIRGREADYTAFIEAMDNVSTVVAGPLITELEPFSFKHLLDVGGASGTWTIAFLREKPHAKATIFDLPQVMPQAQERIDRAGMSSRVSLVAGDFYKDKLPTGADLAWVSAIVHQNSREQNRDLFAKVYEALEPGGQILIRDIVMDASRTSPVAGALFAVNMLAGTPHGGTFTLAELDQDLSAAGFTDVQLIRRDNGMHSIVSAQKA